MNELIRYFGRDIFDYILINVQKPAKDLIDVYAKEGELVENDLEDERLIPANLLGRLAAEPRRDFLKRNLIRHDSKKLAEELVKIVDHL